MRNIVFRRFIKVSITPSSTPNYSLPFVLSSRRNAASAPFHEEEGETVVFPRESPGFSYGLNWALARKGVVVKDKAFCNLTSFELRQKGATIAESLSGLPVHVRGNFLGGASKISKGQFSKLLIQVTSHISSISSILVHDGAIGSSSKCNANVRVVSDSPSAVLSLSNVLWKTHARAVSHDSCPLTVYVATSISPGAGESIGLGAKGNNEFIAADIERSSLILCGRAFSDTNGVKEALAALSGPIISSRGGLPLSARLLQSDDSMALLFASEDTIQRCTDLLVSVDAGVILSSQGVAPMFQIGNSSGPDLFRLPNAVILVTSDSSGVIPSVSELSPGQAAYHFLAGCQNVKFIPAYSKGPSSIDPLELSKALLSKLKENQISSFLINAGDGKNTLPGKDLLKLLKSALSKKVQPFEPKGGDLQRRYKSFLLEKFQVLPEEFSF